MYAFRSTGCAWKEVACKSRFKGCERITPGCRGRELFNLKEPASDHAIGTWRCRCGVSAGVANGSYLVVRS